MSQQVKVIASKTDEPNKFPGTHIVERNNSHMLFSDLHTHTCVCVHTYIGTWEWGERD